MVEVFRKKAFHVSSHLDFFFFFFLIICGLHEVTQLSFQEGTQIIDAMLAKGGRKLTKSQRNVILDMFNNCPTPLFLKYAYF